MLQEAKKNTEKFSSNSKKKKHFGNFFFFFTIGVCNLEESNLVTLRESKILFNEENPTRNLKNTKNNEFCLKSSKKPSYILIKQATLGSVWKINQFFFFDQRNNNEWHFGSNFGGFMILFVVCKKKRNKKK